MKANTIGDKCLKSIFLFVQKYFQRLIWVLQLKVEDFKSLNKKEIGREVWGESCISVYALY